MKTRGSIPVTGWILTFAKERPNLMRTLFLLFVVLPCFALASPAPAQAAKDRVLLGVGAFSFDDDQDEDLAAEARLEYLFGLRGFEREFGPHFNGIGPYVALNVNTDGGVFGSGGFFLDIEPHNRVSFRPFAGIGGYSEGGSRDLGGVFQFETGATLAYRLENETEVGIMFKHISNAGIHDRNPGVNSLMLTVSVPLNLF